jgi:hypothetical protein
LALALLLLPQVAAQAGTLDKKVKDEWGTTYWGSFKNAPFPDEGKKYSDDSIALFVPEHFCPVLIGVKEKRKKGWTSERFECWSKARWAELKKKKGVKARRHAQVDYVVHFHGHSNTVAKAMANHKLPEQFAMSLQNAILVVPQGPVNAIDSYAGKLETRGGFKRMMEEVHALLQDQHVIGRKQKIGRLILSSHSGGYRAAASCLKLGGLEVSELFLFDSLYGYTEVFFSWITGSRSRRLIDVYFRDKPTARSKELMAMLRKAGVRYASFTEKEMTDEGFKRIQLARERVIFVNTDLGHSGCTRGYFNFRDYLFASRLKRVRGTDWFQKKGLDKYRE